MEALNHIFYFNMGLNCPTEEESQFSIFYPNTPLRDHCAGPRNGPPGGQTATYQKTEAIQSYLRIWGTYDPIES